MVHFFTYGVVFVVFCWFLACVCADLLRGHESCTPDRATVSTPGDEWGLVRLSGFHGVGKCNDCGFDERLHRGRCASSWILMIPQLVGCDDCGKLWQPGDDDSADICPRCRVLKRVVTAIDMDTLTETDRIDVMTRATGIARDADMLDLVFTDMRAELRAERLKKTPRPIPMRTVQPDDSRLSDASELLRRVRAVNEGEVQ